MRMQGRRSKHCIDAVRTTAKGILIVVFVLPALAVFGIDPFATAGEELSFRYSVNGFSADHRFSEPAAVALDEHAGLVYVADRQAGEVPAFSLQGVAKLRYGAKEDLQHPIGVAVDRQGNVYVADEAGGPLKIIDARGQVTTLELPAAEDQAPAKFGQMVIDRDHNLYVVERESCRIVVFDKNRQFKFAFGGIGDRQGLFKALQDVAVDRQGRIYTLDAAGDPVQVFDRKGGYLFSFVQLGEPGAATLPTGLSIDRHDQVWIVDQAQHRLKVFDRSGRLLRQFGTYGQGEGEFFHPVDVDIDDFGRVYVVEMGARRMQVFSVNRPFEPFTPLLGVAGNVP